MCNRVQHHRSTIGLRAISAACLVLALLLSMLRAYTAVVDSYVAVEIPCRIGHFRGIKAAFLDHELELGFACYGLPDWKEPRTISGAFGGGSTIATMVTEKEWRVFRMYHNDFPDHWSTYQIYIEAWVLILLFGGMGSIWPLMRLVGRRRRRERFRREKGLCLHCGYDLRASPERCPECGVPVSAKPDGANE